MKKIVGIALALLLAVSVVGAWAADIEGKVQQVDAGDRTVVLDNGTKLWIAEGLGMERLKEGASVKASYEERDGKNVVTQMEVAE